MKIWLKRILVSVVGLILVTLVGGAIFLLTFDPNAYKSKLETLVFERYQRILAIEGDIELSLFPRIGLHVQNVSLSNRDSAATFASIDSARFAVAIWPLLFNRLVVDHVTLAGFKAWVVRDQQGRFNFSDLVSADPPFAWADDSGAWAVPTLARPSQVSSASDAAPIFSNAYLPLASATIDKADFQIDIAGLALKGGEVHFADYKTSSIGRISDLELSTGRMTFEQAFNVALKGKLHGISPSADARLEAQALVQLDPHQRTYSAQRANVALSGQLGDLTAKSLSLRGNVAYSEFSQMLSVAALEVQLQGDLQGEEPLEDVEADVTIPHLRIDRSQAELQVTRMGLRAQAKRDEARFELALDAPLLLVSPDSARGEPMAASIKRSEGEDVLGLAMQMSDVGGNAYELSFGEVSVDGVYRKQDRLLGVKLSSPASWSPFGQRGELSAVKGDVRLKDAALANGHIEFPFIGNLRGDLLKDELTSDINAVFNGSKMDFRLSATQLKHPSISFDLAMSALDLESVFPLADRAESTASDTDEDESSSEKEAPQTRVPEAEATQTSFDWSFLNKADAQGKVSIDTLRSGEVELQQVNADVLAKNGELRLQDVSAELYGGQMRGHLRASSTHEIDAEFAFEHVEVGQVLAMLSRHKRLEGRGDIQARLHTQGATPAALLAGLDGHVRAKVADGALLGLDLGQTIKEANEVLRNAFSGQLPRVQTRLDPVRRTQFTSLLAEASLEQGQGRLDGFEMHSPQLRVQTGEPANFDLVNRQLDAVFYVTALEDPEEPSSSKAPGADLLGVRVPLRISGPFTRPVYRVQWQDIPHRMVKDAIQEGLLDILKLGPGQGSGLFPISPDEAAPADTRDTLKNLGKALKGLIKQ